MYVVSHTYTKDIVAVVDSENKARKWQNQLSADDEQIYEYKEFEVK